MQDLLATIIKISYTPEKTAVAKDIWPLSRKRIYTLMFGMACQKNKHNVIIKCAKDISSFAQAVGQQAKDIDSKVCKDKKKGTADNGPESTNGLQGRWSCQDPKGGGNTATNYDTFSKRFGELEGHSTRVKGDNANKTRRLAGLGLRTARTTLRMPWLTNLANYNATNRPK